VNALIQAMTARLEPLITYTGSNGITVVGQKISQDFFSSDESILIDGEQYYQYDRDLDQLLIQPLSEEIGVLPRLLMSGSARKIEEKFSVQSMSSDGSAVNYQLTPMESSALFSEISLVFDSEKLSSMSITDELGQRNQFIFVPMDKDYKISMPLFEVKPEPGTEVIYQ